MLRRSLQNFMTVVRRGSIRAAATELGVAQSAISRQLQALEHELGATIIERNARGIRLTPAGELLYAHGQDASFKTGRFYSELDAFRGLDRGHIRLSSVETLVPHLLPHVLSGFHAAHPAVTLSVTIASTGDVIHQVVDGKADFGICFSTLACSGVHTVARYQEPLLAVVPRGHPLDGRASVGMRDLVPYAVAMSTRSTGVGLLLDFACRKAGVTLAATVETNSLNLLRQFVSHGCGVAVMTRQSVLESLGAHAITAIPLDDDALDTGSVDVITATGRRLPLPAERLLLLVQAQLAVTPC